MKILRSILGVFVGVVVGTGLVAAIEQVSRSLYPPPPGADLTDPEQIAAFVRDLPPGALLIVAFAHLVGPLAGAWLAARVAGWRPMTHAIVTGAVFLFFGLLNLVMVPHPLWFGALDLLMYPLAAWVAGTLARRGVAAPAP